MAIDPRNVSFRSVATTLTLAFAAFAGTWGSSGPVSADRSHVVRPGQSLEIIGKRYGRSAAELAAANGIHRDGILRQGQVLKVPAKGVLYVAAGQTLSEIAEAHHVSTLALARANHIHPDAILQIGQKLTLPGATAAGHADKRASKPDSSPRAKRRGAGSSHKATAKLSARHSSRWGKPKRRGVVTMYRLWSRESLHIRLVDSRGRPRQDARRRLRELLRPRDSRRRKMPNTRLLSLLARVSDHFGGRTIHVISGYRLPKGLTRKTSRHVAGQAIDFRIPGVPLTVLRDYCEKFSDVGVGYYPTTHFVHLDVRKQPARWTDWSLPGQPPVLTKPADYDENSKDDLLAPQSPTETTAEHKTTGAAPRRVDGPTG